MPLKRVSMVTLMQFLSQSLHSLSPALDNELANALPSPPPHWAYLLCTKGSERYFWSPSSHLFPWFGDDNNHCGFRCHIQINCHSSSAIGPASPCLAKSPCASLRLLLPPLPHLSWKQYKKHWSSVAWYVSLLSLFKSGVWKLTLFALYRRVAEHLQLTIYWYRPVRGLGAAVLWIWNELDSRL